MKLKVINKIISISLIVIMFSHLTFLHNFFQDYVLCNELDGNVTVENINEHAAFSNSSSSAISITAGQSIYDVNNCQDTLLDEYCIDENGFIPKDKVDLNVNLANTWETITPSENEFKIYKFVDKTLLKENHILKNYSTVSLLI
ncbi:hypothetical protein MNBD_IGNAVI01-3030 [hydrothermal vent metagenome]|uniref:Uncharacterized protein n=1 Tax=hydrothermal vent metagenome TaxID=652676 RepID=A0A3B1BBC9_9ZZZZ